MELIDAMRAYPDTLQAIGVLGFLLYVATFSAVQAGYLCGNGISFSIFQVSAASCVLISLVGAFNLASFLIQISYIAIGVFGIIIRKRRKSGAYTSARSNPTLTYPTLRQET